MKFSYAQALTVPQPSWSVRAWVRHALSHSGFHSCLIEDHVVQPQSFATQVACPISEGVFAMYPDLKVVLIETGVTWMPALMRRMSKDWRGARIEVPLVQEGVGSQPLDAPTISPMSARRSIICSALMWSCFPRTIPTGVRR